MNVYDIFGSGRRAAVTESKIEVVHEYTNEDFNGLMMGVQENVEGLNVGDPVVVTGPGIEFEGATGEVVDFGRDKRFVVVNLYNHGQHSFHSSDVSYNDYADSEGEEADAYDRDADARDWQHNEDIAGPGGSDNNDSTSPIHGFGEDYDNIPDLENVGEQVVSIMDAERRLAQGDRIFAFHEMDEEPSEIRNVGQLAGYDAEQLLAVPQGVAEASDPNFLKFMNTSLGDRVDSPASAQKTGNAQYDNAPVTDLDSGNVGYRAALDFCMKTLQKLTPTQKTKLATRGEDGVTEWLAKQAAKTGVLPNQFVEEDIVEVQDYLSDVFRDPAITSWALVLTDGEPLPKRPSKAPYTIQMNKGYGPGTDEHGNKHGVQIRGRDWVTVDVLDNAHEAAEMFKGLVAKNPNYYYHMIDGTGRYVASHNVYKKSVTEGSLEELANTSLKVKEPKNSVNINDRKQVTYKVMKFKSGKDTYLINFTVRSAPAFGKKQNWNAVNVAFGVREEQDEYSFGDEINTDLTARNKNQFLIYSTVINAIRKFITEYNTEIDEIIMQGAGERQEAMYQRFFQSAGKYFPGWHFNGKHSLVRDIPRKPVKKVREQGVAEGKIQYGVLDNDNVNLIIDKSVNKPDGIYSFRGILFRVKGGKVTHYAANGKILQAMGRVNTQIGSYDSSTQAKSILKSIKQGVAEGRVLHRDLKSWTDDAKSQGLNVIKPKNDLEWTHHATDKTGKVCGKFCTTNVPQNSRGFIHKQGLAEMDDDEVDYDDKYQAMVKRVGQKAREQQRHEPVDLVKLAQRLRQADKTTDTTDEDVMESRLYAMRKAGYDIL